MASVMTADNAVALRVDSANRRRPGTTSTSGGGRTKLLPTITGVGAATERQGENAVPSLSCSTAVVSHHSSQRLHFLTHCGTGWAGCLRDQVRQCWTMFTKRKKGKFFIFFFRYIPFTFLENFLFFLGGMSIWKWLDGTIHLKRKVGLWDLFFLLSVSLSGKLLSGAWSLRTCH